VSGHALPGPKKSVALSGVAAGNTALCTVGRSGNDLHYRGYDILTSPTPANSKIAPAGARQAADQAELAAYKAKLKALRGLPANVKAALEGCRPAPTRWT
jgi:2-methylcitrate synthase